MADRRDSGNMSVQESSSSDEEWDQRQPEKVKETGPIHIHYSDFEIAPPAGAKVKYCHLKEKCLQDFAEMLLAKMETEDRPLYITADVLTAYFLDESYADITSVIKAVTEAAIESGRHRITWSTLRYCPDSERYWIELGDLNTWIRNYTAQTGEQHLSFHKIYLKPRNGQLFTFAEMYEEWWRKSALGQAPSDAAVVVNATWCEKHHSSAYGGPRIPREPSKEVLPIPCPLGITPDYTEDEKILSILKSRGLFRGRRTRSEARRSGTRKGSHRTLSRERSDSCVSGARPRGARTPDSISALERLLNRVSRMPRKDDPHGTEREASRVTSKIAELYTGKCQELTRYQLEVESLRLELELVREARDIKMESEVTKLKDENRYLREAQSRADRLADKLVDIKESLRLENDKLYNELQLLKMSKKERRAHKKKAGKK